MQKESFRIRNQSASATFPSHSVGVSRYMLLRIMSPRTDPPTVCTLNDHAHYHLLTSVAVISLYITDSITYSNEKNDNKSEEVDDRATVAEDEDSSSCASADDVIDVWLRGSTRPYDIFMNLTQL